MRQFAKRLFGVDQRLLVGYETHDAVIAAFETNRSSGIVLNVSLILCDTCWHAASSNVMPASVIWRACMQNRAFISLRSIAKVSGKCYRLRLIGEVKNGDCLRLYDIRLQ